MTCGCLSEKAILNLRFVENSSSEGIPGEDPATTPPRPVKPWSSERPSRRGTSKFCQKKKERKFQGQKKTQKRRKKEGLNVDDGDQIFSGNSLKSEAHRGRVRERD